MASKEVKIILKEVREAIKNEKYSEAIEKCKSLLNDDSKNYMALILLGAAYQNSNKAEAANYLRQAVACSPGAPTVALQGLANCAPIEELPDIYQQLLALVPEKFKDYHEKLSTIAANKKVTQQCLTVLKTETSSLDEDRVQSSLLSLAKVWIGQDYETVDEDLQLLKLALQRSIRERELEIHLNCYKRYLKLLYKEGDLKNLINYASDMVDVYPKEVYPLEWICKVYCENYKAINDIEKPWTSLKHPIEYYSDELFKLNPQSSLSLLIQAINAFDLHQFVTARDLLYRVQVIQPNYHVAVNLLAQVEMKLGAYGIALQLFKKLDCINQNYAECISHSSDSESLNEAVELLLTCEKNSAVLHSMARCYSKLGLIEKLKDLSLPITAKAEFLMDPAEAVAALEICDYRDTFEVLLLMGKTLIKLRKYKDALPYLLRATRLQPYTNDCFLYLGQIYFALDDLLRARKCFEKCVNLYPMCEDAINSLSAIYQQNGEEDINAALLLNTLKNWQNLNAKWIQYKLGLHYMSAKKWDDAINSFRSAIKCDVSCIIYWESLGDAYYERGSYNSAIRVFEKILTLDLHNTYAKLQIALIKMTIRMYNEAIEDFDDLLREHPDNLPGLKGAAEAHIGVAHNLKIENRLGRSKSHLQIAVNHLQRAFIIGGNLNMVWLWRLTASLFLTVAQMPTSMANLEVTGKLAKRDDTDIVRLERRDLLELATRFYACALKLKQNTFLWYELSLCAYYSAQYLPFDEEKHMELAVKACKASISQDINRWQNWNLFGVLNMHKSIKDYPLAQHCFIQALQLDRKSYITWTNLGVLYMQLDEIKLANQSFQRAQQSRPTYPNAWIGQAMIAEIIADEEEALDLFRHCTQFEFHPEAALGYAYWVCRILSDEAKCQQPHYKRAIEKMFADTVALDAINRYVQSEENDCCADAFSYEGFLKSRHKLWLPAISAYQQAVKKAEGDDRDKMNTSLGYLFLKVNQPYEAIKAFDSVSQASFRPIVGLALAYFRSGQHQEAYSVYNSVLKSVTDNEDDKAAMILVAMASMVYASQGEADTKTILYQSILLKNSPIQALYSAYALGILHGDKQLSETILNELKKHENSLNYCANIAFLTSQYYLANNETRKGLTYLMSRVHLFPHCSKLRTILANYMLDNYGQMRKYHQSTSQIALSAIVLGHRSTFRSSCIDDAKCLMTASRALSAVDKHRATLLIQRAVHLYPHENLIKVLCACR